MLHLCTEMRGNKKLQYSVHHMQRYAIRGITCCTKFERPSWPLWTWQLAMDNTFESFCEAEGEHAEMHEPTTRLLEYSKYSETRRNIEWDKHTSTIKYYHASMLRDRDTTLGVGRERERERRGHQANKREGARLGFALCLLASNAAESFSWAFGYASIDQYGVCAASTGKKRPNSALASQQEKTKFMYNSPRTIWTSAVCVKSIVAHL